ncbi:MAG: hypothetical protein ABI151_16390 [Chitinophagaceae bacterium]
MEFLPIRAYDNYLVANMRLTMLQNENIVCYLKDEYTLTIDPLMNIALGGMNLMVSAIQFSRAEEILEQADTNYLLTIPCPHCGDSTIQKQSETIIYTNFKDRLKSMLLTGTTQKVNSFYRCSNCRKQFKELPPEDQ